MRRLLVLSLLAFPMACRKPVAKAPPSSTANAEVANRPTQAQLGAIAMIATRSLNPSEQEKAWTNAFVTLLLTLFLVTTGGALNFLGSAFEVETPAPVQYAAPVVPSNVTPF